MIRGVVLVGAVYGERRLQVAAGRRGWSLVGGGYERACDGLEWELCLRGDVRGKGEPGWAAAGEDILDFAGAEGDGKDSPEVWD